MIYDGYASQLVFRCLGYSAQTTREQERPNDETQNGLRNARRAGCPACETARVQTDHTSLPIGFRAARPASSNEDAK
jgi:hypothetical protein